VNRLTLLSTFTAVAAAGSFTRAAARLGLSKSVASRHVSELERELGVQLMYRSTHGLSLTEAGERCLRHCGELERIAEQAAASATAGDARPSGLLRVTMPQTLVVSPVGALVTRFQQAWPEVRLDVRVTSLQVDPVEEGFDVALRLGDQKDSSLVGRRLCEVRYIAAAAPAYLKRRGVPRTPEALAAHNCLTFSEFESRARRRGAARGAPPATGNLTTNSGVLLMNALLAGQGIAIGPDILFAPHLRAGRLKAVLEAAVGARAGLYALFPAGRYPAAARRAFVDFLAAAL
jgi:DNA-binding transcriptional LysR family regulator